MLPSVSRAYRKGERLIGRSAQPGLELFLLGQQDRHALVVDGGDERVAWHSTRLAARLSLEALGER